MRMMVMVINDDNCDGIDDSDDITVFMMMIYLLIVDNGIMRHLWDELTESFLLIDPTVTNTTNSSSSSSSLSSPSSVTDSSVKLFITHFLGVDHIGHTHHAYHPLMRDRITLMDQLMNDVVKALPDDAVLFLMGDHGMTDAGEHGK